MIKGVTSCEIELLSQENVGLAWQFNVNPESCAHPEFYRNHLIFNALYEKQNGYTTTHLLIDKVENRIMGFVSLRTSSVLTRHESGKTLGDPAIEISVLAVDQDYERRGVGRSLILHAISEAMILHENHLGVRNVILAADAKAVKFYEKMGFSQLDQTWDSDIPRETWNLTCRQMCMRLIFDN